MSTPPNDLEMAAKAAQAGIKTSNELVETFLAATIYLPSSTDPATDGVTPVLTDIKGIPHMAVASSAEALTATQHAAQWAVNITGRQVIEGLAPEGGVVVNMPTGGGFQFTPEVLAQIRADHGIATR